MQDKDIMKQVNSQPFWPRRHKPPPRRRSLSAVGVAILTSVHDPQLKTYTSAGFCSRIVDLEVCWPC